MCPVPVYQKQESAADNPIFKVNQGLELAKSIMGLVQGGASLYEGYEKRAEQAKFTNPQAQEGMAVINRAKQLGIQVPENPTKAQMGQAFEQVKHAEQKLGEFKALESAKAMSPLSNEKWLDVQKNNSIVTEGTEGAKKVPYYDYDENNGQTVKYAYLKPQKMLNDNETKLREEYSKNGITQDTQKMVMAYEKMQSVAKQPSAAGDLALIFNYMKVLDPPSTVRESEQASAQNAAGVPERIRALYNNVREGRRLTDSQIEDFLAQSKNLYNAQIRAQKGVDQHFQSLAERNSLDFQNIVRPLSEIPSTIAQPKKGLTVPGFTKEAQASDVSPAVKALQDIEGEAARRRTTQNSLRKGL